MELIYLFIYLMPTLLFLINSPKQLGNDLEEGF